MRTDNEMRHDGAQTYDQCADEIVPHLMEALAPFVDLAKHQEANDENWSDFDTVRCIVRIGDLRNVLFAMQNAQEFFDPTCPQCHGPVHESGFCPRCKECVA